MIVTWSDEMNVCMGMQLGMGKIETKAKSHGIRMRFGGAGAGLGMSEKRSKKYLHDRLRA